jgi:hypothetical protein
LTSITVMLVAIAGIAALLVAVDRWLGAERSHIKR